MSAHEDRSVIVFGKRFRAITDSCDGCGRRLDAEALFRLATVFQNTGCDDNICFSCVDCSKPEGVTKLDDVIAGLMAGRPV